MLKRLISTMMAAAFVFAVAAPATYTQSAWAGDRHWSDGDHHGDKHWKKRGHGHDYGHAKKNWKKHHRGHGYGHRHEPTVVYKYVYRDVPHYRHYDEPRRHYHREQYRHKSYDRHSYDRAGGLDFSGISGGNIVGAILGAAAGTQIGKGSGRTAAIIGGTIIGAIIGGEVENSLERSDRMQSYHTLEKARDGETVAWRNPNTNARYQMTPKRTYQTASNQYCREYTSWAFVNGYEEQVVGTACRMPDGSWKIVK